MLQPYPHKNKALIFDIHSIKRPNSSKRVLIGDKISKNGPIRVIPQSTHFSYQFGINFM